MNQLYRLADGTQADPSACKADDKGVMRHSNGVPVVIDSDGKPVEIAREAEVNKTAMAAKLGDDAATKVVAKDPDVVMRENERKADVAKVPDAVAKPAANETH